MDSIYLSIEFMESGLLSIFKTTEKSINEIIANTIPSVIPATALPSNLPLLSLEMIARAIAAILKITPNHTVKVPGIARIPHIKDAVATLSLR